MDVKVFYKVVFYEAPSAGKSGKRQVHKSLDFFLNVCSKMFFYFNSLTQYHSKDLRMPLILANTDKTLEQIIMDRVTKVNSNGTNQYSRHKDVPSFNCGSTHTVDYILFGMVMLDKENNNNKRKQIRN